LGPSTQKTRGPPQLTDTLGAVPATSGANRVDEAKLATLRDVPAPEVRMAEPAEIGETLLAFETVWAAAGTPEAVFPVDPGRVRELAGATPAGVAAE
jgi:prolyl-tRNA editing enzyme YbaK/EbsC (Cys-tRNA(Pro) deacylase)